ncbi:Glutamate-1-semialdehyde 2,1-aminomutase [Posidoniimonas polymericola]|uniref:Glutamate-1-semialdehyde 2,1-aminomutase n=1 Tax=Posidoniimonas polymericola TaxID=2528002 RepID=A0A5C5YQ76_9BACT|nr:glutamate-1-semialdehyde 2,1-aminomutase [Posidoniimonas polymericola]TWT77065.1 Glutamate-1-semialdehyde 2,1-aminomutase [Posidoniimonas polymericola]
MTNLNLAASHDAFARAKQLMPGGVNSPARAFGAVGGEPVFIASAKGAQLFDIDGNAYLDYVGSWGPMILGHAYPPVVDAVRSAAVGGTSFGAPTVGENELASLIIECVPSVERVRLVNSGTEATMSALRLARGFTGRPLVVKFAGNYHGHVDSLLVAAGSAAATLGAPNSPGVTPRAAADTLVLPYNDPAALVAVFAEHGPQIAAVIFEPVCGNMGVVVPTKEFRDALATQTKQHGALLICDEVMTGFRLSLGGAQQLLGITPDLTTLGKIVGGGLPVGAYGGRSDVMAHVLPEGKVFQAGTLSGNPLATAAGATTLRTLRDEPPYARLDALGEQLQTGLDQAATAVGLPHHVARVGSMVTLFFVDEEVTSWDVAARCDTALFAKYFWAMLRRGVYLPCSQYEALFISAAHTESDIQRTIDAARESLAEVAGG